MLIENFQAHWIGLMEDRIALGGESRGRCSQIGLASIYHLENTGRSKLVWSDNDQFGSAVQSVYETPDGFAILIKRHRPVGVRSLSVVENDGGSKHWGDTDNVLREYSINGIDKNGRSSVKFDSSFGISSFPRGAINYRGHMVIYGSLGGRPAIARELSKVVRQ